MNPDWPTSVRMDGVVHAVDGWPTNKVTTCGLTAHAEDYWPGPHEPTCAECVDRMPADLTMFEVDQPWPFKMAQRLAQRIERRLGL